MKKEKGIRKGYELKEKMKERKERTLNVKTTEIKMREKMKKKKKNK